jgi:hypothetical protein
MQLGPCQNDPTAMGADVRFQWNEFTSGDVLKRTGQGFQFLFGTRWNKHSCALLQKHSRNPFSDCTSSARNYDKFVS